MNIQMLARVNFMKASNLNATVIFCNIFTCYIWLWLSLKNMLNTALVEIFEVFIFTNFVSGHEKKKKKHMKLTKLQWSCIFNIKVVTTKKATKLTIFCDWVAPNNVY